MTQVNLDLDAEFAEALYRSPDTVVVWAPSRFKENLYTPCHRIFAVIQECYEPAGGLVFTRFGEESQRLRCRLPTSNRGCLPG